MRAYIPWSLLLIASASFASGAAASTVHWDYMAGVITAENVNNPVGNIDSGTFPWSVERGSASVNLSTGTTSFRVDGLVINGQVFSGTPGPVTEVVGTLVCNPGEQTQVVLDTEKVHLDRRGDTRFSGHIQNIPEDCDNPLFLIRIATPAGAAGRWIATGAERF